MTDGPGDPAGGQDTGDDFDRRVQRVLDEQDALLSEQADLLIATGSTSVERPAGTLTASLRAPAWGRPGELMIRTVSAAGNPGSGRIPVSRAEYRDHARLRGEIELQIAVHLAALEEE
jgi:hypothetical protein